MVQRYLYRLVVVVSLLSIVWGCSPGKSYKYKIGVSQCVGGMWRDKANNEMLSAQHLYDTDVKVVITNADHSTGRQRQQIDSLLNTNIDLLVISPNEYGPLASSVDKAHKRGIPVILFERKTASPNFTAFIGGDNLEAGRAMGRYAVRLCRDSIRTAGRKPVVLQITGRLVMSPDRERYEGFSSVMTRHPEIAYHKVESNWSPEESYAITRKWLLSGKPVDIIFCQNDLTTLGAYKAAKELGREKTIRFMGVDGLPNEGIAAIERGEMAATYIYPTDGEKVIRLALNILEHKPYKRINTLSSLVVTPQNVDEIAVNAKALMEQNDYLITIQNKLEEYLGLYHAQRTLLTASVVAVLILIVALLLVWRAIVVTRRANRRMRELSDEQTQFFDNASHQLRTPLTLIIGPLRKLSAKNSMTDPDERKLLGIILRNADKLQQLVTDVLHFRKENRQLVADNNFPDVLETSRKLVQNGQRGLVMHGQDDELATVLIVDDNDDIRQYLHTLLSERYYIIEASDGVSGLKLARESVPDLVVSDVMMPVMDGLTFCSKLKSHPLTSHIPVILLTARSSGAQQAEGLSMGADAYLTKPFDAEVLIAQIDSLLVNRRHLRELFSKEGRGEGNAAAGAESPEISTPDRQFMDHLRTAINKNMGNAKLKMDDIGAELGISRVQLYRKVKALTGLSPVELLRQFRLQRAYKLLQSTDKTVAEVCYEVGFSTPGYFSSCFKRQYGKYPTELKRQEK